MSNINQLKPQNKGDYPTKSWLDQEFKPSHRIEELVNMVEHYSNAERNAHKLLSKRMAATAKQSKKINNPSRIL